MKTIKNQAKPVEEMTPYDILERWPRLCAHMICESLGYFTPVKAALAIQKFKTGEAYYCEWYSDINHKRGLDLFDEEGLKQATRDVVHWAIQGRHRHQGYMADFNTAKQVIRRELSGHGPTLASWF